MFTESDKSNLERLIAETRAADQAGVFRRTRLDVAPLVTAPAPSRLVRFYERALVGLPLAACLAIVAGIAWMSGGIGSTGNMGVVPSPLAVLDSRGMPDTAITLCSVEVVARCADGPGKLVSADCDCADFDSDGDVDLLDVSSFQRLAANIQ